jgi:small GTP-binding protein
MPANLPPEYYEAEKHYKEAQGTQQKIAALEALIATIPKHKGTDKLRADFRKRLSKLREAGDKSKKGGKGDLYNVQREGAAQICLMGFANAGKSSIVKALTNAEPMVGEFPMTTVMPLSGMMPFEDVLIQLVDLPPIGYEASDGWVSGILRNSDVILLVVDLADDAPAQVELLLDQLNTWRITDKPLVIAANKVDAADAQKAISELNRINQDAPVIALSTETMAGLEDMRAALFSAARIIRVYSKEPGKEADLGKPFTLPEGTTVLDLGERIQGLLSEPQVRPRLGFSKDPGPEGPEGLCASG